MRSIVFICFLILTTVIIGDAQNARKVLFIGCDGVRGDVLREIPTPNIDLLTEKAVYSYDAINNGITISGPGWSNLFTGVLHDKHNVTGNSFEAHQLEAHPDFLQVIKKHLPHYETAAFYTWLPIGIILNEVDIRVARKYALGGDAYIHRLAQDYLKNESADATVVYYADADVAGHNYGFDIEVAPYYREIVRFDRYVGDLIEAIHARPFREEEDWLVVISTDHGGYKTGHGGETMGERNIFLIAAGDEVKPRQISRRKGPKPKSSDPLSLEHLKKHGYDQVPTQLDAMPTILDFLDIPMKTYELEGRSLLNR